jgi:TrmH family RNA methyltransferase
LYNEKVIRATQGAIFKINIIINDLKETIAYLQKHDIKVFGTSLESSKFLQEYKINNNYAILLGNEANGVKKELLQLTNDNIKIEIDNKLESLNVAVAGSIIMYYFNNQN